MSIMQDQARHNLLGSRVNSIDYQEPFIHSRLHFISYLSQRGGIAKELAILGIYMAG